MAKMQVGPAGIETISGALKRPKKQNGHNHGNYLVAIHRVAATTNPNCQRVYTFAPDRYNRSTPVSAEETAHRNKFGAICAAVAARRKDLSKISQDNANFKAQKDEAGGYKTMRSYLFHLEKVAWEQANG